MGKNLADLKKTLYYFQRNGLKSTISAVSERLEERKKAPYVFVPASQAELKRERAAVAEGISNVFFSIVVPTFQTPEVYLRRMIESVLNQTYPRFELLLADASGDDSVKRVVDTYQDPRISYLPLSENLGIAGNTNKGIIAAVGEYIGLLDHDDILCENALYEMVVRIEAAKREKITLELLYSDEDKCDENESAYFEPNLKEDYNPDMLLSNNYICHFLVMKSELMKQLTFRKEYDGAQDFDMVLRAAAKLWGKEYKIAHIDKVLYHWRCHSNSTAENPQSKRYAYEAGAKAIQDFVDKMGWLGTVEESRHLGFYNVVYRGNLFEMRPELGAIGGRVLKDGKIAGGRMSKEGEVFYLDLPEDYSGYLHRATLQQTAKALDLRNLELNPRLYNTFELVTGVPYRTIPGGQIFDVNALPEGTDISDMSVRLAKAIRKAGYTQLYMPERTVELS